MPAPDLSDRVCTIVHTELMALGQNVPRARITPAARLADDLHCDHIAVLCIVIEIEDAMRIFVDPDAVEPIVTVADLIALVEAGGTMRAAA